MERQGTQGGRSGAGSVTLPEAPWASTSEEVLEALGVSAKDGLDEKEAASRRRRFGTNRLREARTASAWRLLLDQFMSLIVVLLAGAAIVAFAFDEWVEGAAIVAVILINSAIGFFTELRAVRSMEALRRMGGTTALVRRGGQAREINAEEIVPGDVIILDAGDAVTADLRLVEASKLQINESTLTGESTPVGKQLEVIAEDSPLAERGNMVFKGTFVTRGSGLGIATGTGMDTELGQISSLVEEAAEEERTPLEKRLDQLGRQLVWVTLAITAVVAVLGIVRGKEVFLMIETGVALAVAAIPEGLPVVATIALARGMLRMARRNALIRRLGAVETLGATNVIFTDKTGTLTENRMTVTRMVLASGEVVSFDQEDEPTGRQATPEQEDPRSSRGGTARRDLLREGLEIGVLCNNASLEEKGDPDGVVGDPMEVALLVAARRRELSRPSLLEEYPEVREVAFDPDVKMMATVHRQNGGFRVAVKGAPEAVLERCTRFRREDGEEALDGEHRERWSERTTEMAEDGLRVLALASKVVESSEAEPYEDLVLLALVGIKDPTRSDVPDAVEACRRAGIRVVMVTGDQPVTARTIGREARLVDDDSAKVVVGKELGDDPVPGDVDATVFARVSPKQKLALIDAYQERGAIVAMTGDGVNDAPALEKADIGIAMGQRGTQVAREASDMILQDDAFPTIVAAIEQGRVIFGNIRKFVVYLLSCNVSEVAVVGIASIAGSPLPVLPLQILFLNLVTDVFPALALGVGEGSTEVMDDPPRDPTEPVLPAGYWWKIVGYALTMTVSVLGALALALQWLKLEEDRAVTVSFLTLALSQLWHVFNMRDEKASFFRNDITRNRFVWGALLLCVGLLAAAVYVPGLADVIEVRNPGPAGLLLAFLMSLIPCGVGLIASLVSRR